jgi:hypothetical protein
MPHNAKNQFSCEQAFIQISKLVRPQHVVQKSINLIDLSSSSEHTTTTTRSSPAAKIRRQRSSAGTIHIHQVFLIRTA